MIVIIASGGAMAAMDTSHRDLSPQSGRVVLRAIQKRKAKSQAKYSTFTLNLEGLTA
jgi:hypothetical protein